MKTKCQCGKKIKVERIKMRAEVLDKPSRLTQYYWLCPWCKTRYNTALEDDTCRDIKERMRAKPLGSAERALLEQQYKTAMDELNGRK